MNNEAADIREMQEGTIFVWSNTLLFKPVPESPCERRGGIDRVCGVNTLELVYLCIKSLISFHLSFLQASFGEILTFAQWTATILLSMGLGSTSC